MPIDDPELPFGLADCRDGSRQAQPIRDSVEGVCEENEIHGVRQDQMVVGRASRSNHRPRAIQHGKVDVDGIDAIRATRERRY